MNKSGTALLFALMLGVLFFFLGIALAPALNEVVDESMSTPELNCSDQGITDQDKAICTSIDIMTFAFTGVIFGLAGFLVGWAVF